MAVGTLGSSRITNAVVQVPAWGAWYADVQLDDALSISGQTAIQIADLSLSGTVISGGPFRGRANYRIVGGKGGWGKVLPPKGYNDGLGVKQSTVIGDAAAECGELVSGTTTARLGPHYIRRAAPASAVLPARGWYVDYSGITQIGQRAATAYSGQATIVNVDRARGSVELVTESLAGIQPGVVVEGITALDVEIELTPKRLTVRLYGAPSGTNRRAEAMRKMIEALFPDMRYRGLFEFRVVSQQGDLLNLQPVRVSSGLPNLLRVPMRLPPGVRANFTLGSLVLVGFVDSDRTRPVVVSGDDPSAPGWQPLLFEIGEQPTLGAARLTDTVQAGPFAGVITGASARCKIGV